MGGIRGIQLQPFPICVVYVSVLVCACLCVCVRASHVSMRVWGLSGGGLEGEQQDPVTWAWGPCDAVMGPCWRPYRVCCRGGQQGFWGEKQARGIGGFHVEDVPLRMGRTVDNYRGEGQRAFLRPEVARGLPGMGCSGVGDGPHAARHQSGAEACCFASQCLGGTCPQLGRFPSGNLHRCVSCR